MTTVPVALSRASFSSVACIVAFSSPPMATRSKKRLPGWGTELAEKFSFKAIFSVFGYTFTFALEKRKDRAKTKNKRDMKATTHSVYRGEVFEFMGMFHI